MNTRPSEPADGARLLKIDAAFRAGDLAALQDALGGAGLVPHGPMPDAIGPCLVYAIYHSPISFLRTLLDLGADPKAAVDDGFPPLIAAIATGTPRPGTTPHSPTRVDDVLVLLLARGADPSQRGLNDYTALHWAVAEGNLLAVQRLLDAGADPNERTRIDECETPLDLARTLRRDAFIPVLERRGRPLRQRLRSGLFLQWDVPGDGAVVQRQHRYGIRMRTWLENGEAVRLTVPDGPVGVARLGDETTLYTEVLLNRGRLINGVFYGMEGMSVGGTRRLLIASHMAYGARGVPGAIPPNTDIIVEVTVVESLT